jgi:hypothetical protein
LEYIPAIWYILRVFGNLVAIWYIFSHFGILCQEKSGNPDPDVKVQFRNFHAYVGNESECQLRAFSGNPFLQQQAHRTF